MAGLSIEGTGRRREMSDARETAETIAADAVHEWLHEHLPQMSEQAHDELLRWIARKAEPPLASRDAVIAEQAKNIRELEHDLEVAQSELDTALATLAERTRERDESDAVITAYWWSASIFNTDVWREAAMVRGKAAYYAAIERHRNKDAGSPTG
jgi:hypothetical protein